MAVEVWFLQRMLKT